MSDGEQGTETKYETLACEQLTLDPESFGLSCCRVDDLNGGDAAENAEMIRSALSGEPGARADIVAINAGAALYVGGASESIEAGVERARAVMTDGTAIAKLDAYIAVTREIAA